MNKEPRALLLKGRGKTTIMSFFLKNENVLYIDLKTLFGTKYGLRKLDGVTMCVILDSSTKEIQKYAPKIKTILEGENILVAARKGQVEAYGSRARFIFVDEVDDIEILDKGLQRRIFTFKLSF